MGNRPRKTNLQAMRMRAGYRSAKAFAEHMGIPVGTYTNYEQGKAQYTLVQAWEFADELGCTIDEIAGREPPEASLTDDEWDVVDGYRTADESQKRRMLVAARLEIEMAEEAALKNAAGA